MWDRIHTDIAEVYAQGGPVVAAILVVSMVGWIILFRLFLTHVVMRAAAPTEGAPLVTRLRFEDALLRDRSSLRFVALLASAAPLLGLLGTVLGMMETFSFLGEQDLPRVDALAGGVSQALLTTQTGLLAALTLLAGHTGLDRSIARRVRDAGLIA